jgi:hypothetical protein
VLTSRDPKGKAHAISRIVWGRDPADGRRRTLSMASIARERLGEECGSWYGRTPPGVAPPRYVDYEDAVSSSRSTAWTSCASSGSSARSIGDRSLLLPRWLRTLSTETSLTIVAASADAH